MVEARADPRPGVALRRAAEAASDKERTWNAPAPALQAIDHGRVRPCGAVQGSNSGLPGGAGHVATHVHAHAHQGRAFPAACAVMWRHTAPVVRAPLV